MKLFRDKGTGEIYFAPADKNSFLVSFDGGLLLLEIQTILKRLIQNQLNQVFADYM